jgi:serine/threonine protein kinase
MPIKKHFLIYFYFILFILATKDDESVTSEDVSEFITETSGGVLDLFEMKKVIKENEEIIEYPETISRNKFLSETLTHDLNTLRNTYLITNPKAGKLFAILENLEAIEINMRMAMHYETKANRYCSVYFMNYEELMKLEENKSINHISFMMKYIDNFKFVNYENAGNTGLFVTKELSRENDLAEDTRRMKFLLNNLGNSMVHNADQMLLKKGSFGTIYALPDDEQSEIKKKVFKVMTFRNSFMKDLIAQMDSGVPVLDMLLFVIKKKRNYFEQVVKEIDMNARINQFKVIDHKDQPGNDPSTNTNGVNYYGCMNIRWKLNFVIKGLPHVFKILRKAYSQLIETPEDVRDVRFDDLKVMLDNNEIDLSKSNAQPPEEMTRQQKMISMLKFLTAMGVYQDYQFINMFDRLDIDLFDEMFQKIYFLNASSLGERLDIYINLSKKLQYLHSIGFSHCDIKTSNILYNIIPEHNLFNLNHSRFRIIDFGMIQGRTRFCQGGTIGYLAPEVEYPLRLPHLSADFLEIIKAAPNISDAEFGSLNLSSYSEFQDSLLESFSVLIPEDYSDLKVFFSDASIIIPQSMNDWIVLFQILTPIFEKMEIIHKVEYDPSPDDIDTLSKKLKVSLKPQLNITLIKNEQVLSNEDIRKKLGQPRRINTNGPMKVDHAQAQKIMMGQPVSPRSKDDQYVQARKEYNKRFRVRRAMLDGSIDYPADLILPLNNSDTFSLGMLFNEMETVLNSFPIFDSFRDIPEADFSIETVQSALYDKITNTFKLKTHRSALTSSLKGLVKDYFKTAHDMTVSANQYSSEIKLCFGQSIKDYTSLIEDVKDFILRMTAFYSYNRPDINEVVTSMETFRQRLKVIEKTAFGSKIAMVNRKIRSTTASFLKQRYNSIYSRLLRRTRILI